MKHDQEYNVTIEITARATMTVPMTLVNHPDNADAEILAKLENGEFSDDKSRALQYGGDFDYEIESVTLP